MPYKDPIKRAVAKHNWYVKHKELTYSRVKARRHLMQTTKICSTCKKRLPFECFYEMKDKKKYHYGYSCRCRQCASDHYFKTKGRTKISKVKVVSVQPNKPEYIPKWDTYEDICQSICHGFGTKLLPKDQADAFWNEHTKRVYEKLEHTDEPSLSEVVPETESNQLDDGEAILCDA